jgi:hypothetical protein
VKRLLAGVLLAALLSAAQAEDAPAGSPGAGAPAALEAPPQRRGYAFAEPDILLRQRLFGLAHGLSLLAAACLDLPAHSASIQDAYAAWHAKQGKTIETIVHDLASYYFGPRAGEAQWPDLSRALNLSNTIETALGEVTLHAACATLPEAITRPRYALDRLLAGDPEPETLPNVVAVPPGLTSRPPTE